MGGTDPTLKPILVTGHYDVVPVIQVPNLYGSSRSFLERLAMALFGVVARLMIKAVSLVF